MTTRNRPAFPAYLTLACLCVALLTGCTQKSPEAGRPDTTLSQPSEATSTPSGPSETPTSPTNSVAPPERPTTASGSSLAAGEAFIGYYVELLNYSYITGDPSAFLTESDKGCLGCKALADYARKTNAKNGGLKGDFKDQLVAVKEIYRGKSGRLGGSATIKTGTYQERPTPGASPIAQPGSTGTMEFTLSPSAGNWVMYEMQIDQ
ncbi:DUF6318 family protein [Kribbella monticola]|uniref:DUF6318 family protein n=1 Tax=Kribbella monticola TaxID=2185285 RepID=UPI0013006BEC|nr:DUF6318 family protein [Kribbella monticola]